MSTIPISPSSSASAMPEAFCFAAFATPFQHVAGVPTSIPRSQLYYWTAKWQQGEAEALGEIEGGEYMAFPDGMTAVRWLLSEDDAED